MFNIWIFFRIDNGGNIFGGVGVDFYIGEI